MGKKTTTQPRRPGRRPEEVRADYAWILVNNNRVFKEPEAPPGDGFHYKQCRICTHCDGGTPRLIQQEGFKSD